MTLILICRSASLIVPMAELPCMRVLKSASQFDPTMWTLLAARRAATAARNTSAGDLFSRPLVAAVPLAGGPVAVVPPPLATFHNRTVPFSLPVARVVASGLNATDQ